MSMWNRFPFEAPTRASGAISSRAERPGVAPPTPRGRGDPSPSLTASGEQPEIDRVCHHAIAGCRRVQVVSTIHCHREPRRGVRIARDGVEVDHLIELTRAAHPLIDRLTVGLACSTEIA